MELLAARDWGDLLQAAVAIVVILGSAIVGMIKKAQGDTPHDPAQAPRSPESTGEFPKPREPHPSARPRRDRRRLVEGRHHDQQPQPPPLWRETTGQESLRHPAQPSDPMQTASPTRLPGSRRSLSTKRTSSPDSRPPLPHVIVQQMVQQKARGAATAAPVTDLSELPAELRLIQKRGTAAIASLKPRTARSKELLQHLRSPHHLRQAIILNELLGPPLSERPPLA